MSFPPQNLQIVHNITLTVAWQGLFNIAVILGLFRQNKIAAYIHAALGFCILFLTYFGVLYLIVPIGFNITVQAFGGLFYAHGILGLLMLGFSVIQVGGGLFTRLYGLDRRANLKFVTIMKWSHSLFGYFLGILYKINIMWIWYYIPQATFIIMGWDIFCLLIWLYLKFQKFYKNKLALSIRDPQTIGNYYLQVETTEDIKQITNEFIIFANHVYNAKDIKNLHPGGTKVIDLIMNRQVDRFIYGMYSAETFPELKAFSHPTNSFKLAGKPIAKLHIQNPYGGYTGIIQDVKIKFAEVVSEKTKIYLLALQPRNSQFIFKGYTSLKQLGQYYSLTINNVTTRLYTTVNFLVKQNLNLMLQLMNLQKNAIQLRRVNRLINQNTQLSMINNKRQALVSRQATTDNYLPIMLKIYQEGIFTSHLKDNNFNGGINLKISHPLGRGLQLSQTKPGKIVIVAGGTGLFPFSDFIDLLFKEYLLQQKHQLSDVIIKQNPLLISRPFQNFNFVLLLAINEPEDIHPITLHQLLRLSFAENKMRIVIRLKKNRQFIESFKSKIQITNEYFTKRLLSETKVENLSRIWICGPPNMNQQTQKSLQSYGFTSQQFLMI